MAKKPLTQIQLDFDIPPPVTTHHSISVEPAEPAHGDVPLTEEPLLGIRNVRLKENPTSTPGKRGRRSLKEISSRVDLIQVPADEELFKKQYYSIGEVALMFREKQSLIRYWETEFDILQPRKNRKGDRYFRPVDIKNLVLIYDLLRRRKFTIDGARDFLKKNKKAETQFTLIQSLQQIRSFLMELRANIS